MIEEATQAMKKAETAAEKRKAKERREDLTRLKRVEQVYVSATLWLRTLFQLDPTTGRHPSRPVGVGPYPAQVVVGHGFCKHEYASTSVIHVFCFSTKRHLS